MTRAEEMRRHNDATAMRGLRPVLAGDLARAMFEVDQRDKRESIRIPWSKASAPGIRVRGAYLATARALIRALGGAVCAAVPVERPSRARR